MKKHLKFICVIVFLLFSLKGYTQCSTPVSSCTISGTKTSGDFKARDMVKAESVTNLQPGNGQQVHLYTDKTIQLDLGTSGGYQSSVNYSDDQVNSAIDLSRPVGKIQGQAGVSSTGQATYDIPIAVPPGTKGMVPSLGISYNSGMSDGILGRGWNIRGLSLITRVMKDDYHDTYTYNTDKGISFDGNDVYALDGIRIIGDPTDLTIGARLENDNFSRITYTNDVFTVETKDGLTMEYGSTADSKNDVVYPSWVTLTWYLAKVTDKAKNYMSYTYYNNTQNNEVAIREIKYTGNSSAGFQPYNSVMFYYDLRTDNSVSYLGGNDLTNSLLLREIDIICESNFTKGYQFKYGFRNQTFLNEIVETGSDNSKLNSTFIKYGENVTTIPPPADLAVAYVLCNASTCCSAPCSSYTETSTPYTFTQHTVVHFHLQFTDFNICFPSTGTVKVFKTNSQVVDHMVSFTDQNGNFDFDLTFEDGDIMYIEVKTQAKGKFIVTASMKDAASNDIIAHALPSGIMTDADYRAGDFNGDGKSDLIAFQIDNISSNGNKEYSGDWNLYINNNDGTSFTGHSQTHIDDFFPYDVIDYSPSWFPMPVLSTYYGPRGSKADVSARPDIKNLYRARQGQIGMLVSDFNGDGMDDIVIGTKPGVNTVIYTVNYSTGTGFTTAGGNPQHPFSFHGDFKSILADIDGDGIPEGIYFDEANADFKVWWFKTGNYVFVNQFTQNGAPFSIPGPNWFTGLGSMDIDGDGIQELIVNSPLGTSVQQINVLKLRINILCPSCTTPTAELVWNETLPAAYYQNFYGDFNGDGINDNIRVNNPSVNQDAQIRYGDGVGFDPFSNVNGTSTFNSDLKHIVCDINNDGKSDFLRLSAGYNSVSFGVAYRGESSSSLTPLGFLYGYEFPAVIDYNYSTSTNHNTSINSEPEFLTGDFDGDGRQDIFFKSTNSGERVIVYFNRAGTEHLVTTISDGFRNKTNFTYTTLATNLNNTYVKGTGATYPVADVQFPLYVVSEISSSNGIGGLNTSDYKYEGAKVHLEGKGFLGFDKVSVSSNASNIKVVSESEVDQNYFERLPVSNKNYLLPSNTLLSEETYDPAPSFEPTVSLAHFMKTNGVKSQDHITGKHVEKVFTYDAFANVVYSSIETDLNALGNETEKLEISTTYESAGTWSTAILNAPLTAITTITRTGGGGSYTRETEYNHDPDNGLLMKSIQDPGSATNKITTSFEYNLAGVCTLKTIAAANCATCIQKNYSYEYDNNTNSKYRFVTKETNPLLQASEAQYDPKWGVPLWTKGIDGLITRFVYDGFGRHIKTVTPDNLVSTVKSEFWQPGNVPADKLGISSNVLYFTTAKKDGSPVSITYNDMMGRILETEGDGFDDKIYTQKEYDAKGNMVTETASYKDNSDPYLTTAYSYRDQDFPNELWKVETTGTPGTNTTEYVTTFPNTNGTIMIETIPPDGKATSKTTDPSGKLIAAHDDGGDIQYDYFSSGQVKEIKINGTSVNKMTYDEYGYQTSLWDRDVNVDPNKTVIYTYDAFGQLISQTDTKGSIAHIFQYDALGRLEHNTLDNSTAGETYTYTYAYVPPGTNGVNQLQQKQVTGTNGPSSSSYTYDALNRVKSYSENTGGEIFTTGYEYDAYSNVSKTTYPNGFSVLNEYNNFGYLTKMKESNSGNMIWQADEVNALGKYTKYTLGNNFQTVNSYNDFGFLRETSSGSMQHLEYDFDIQNGNLDSRTDHLANGGNGLTEIFAYDNLNRLTNIDEPAPLPDLSITYNTDGTIQQKFDAGDYTVYNSNHPDAVEKVYETANSLNNISQNTQNITYNAFNKVQVIEEDNYSLAFTYGPDQQRRKTELTHQSSLETRYFYPGYEKTMTGGNTTEVYYIAAPTGLCAMYVVENGTGSMYYVYKDHLGSILKVTDGSNTYRQSFDAWGRNRNPDYWSYTGILSVPSWLYRGYTGHEHLQHFGLINMNGRCYDPVPGMMLSPDNYVADAASTIAYNRYSYVLNNPLAYTDPTGMNLAPGLENGPPHLLSSFDFASQYDFDAEHLDGGTAYMESLMEKMRKKANNATPQYDAKTNTYSLNGQTMSFSEFVAWEAAHGNLKNLTLQEKLDVLMNVLKSELMTEIGDAGVKGPYVGSTENLAKFGHKDYYNSNGDIISPDKNKNDGVTFRGDYIGETEEGYKRYGNNLIFISKNTIREAWNGSWDAEETFFHEWYHAHDYYSGAASLMYAKYFDGHSLMEISAHTFDFFRYPNPSSINKILLYLKNIK